MKDELTNKKIEEIRNELKGKYPDFRGIYLFGSRARGDFNEDSDYDILLAFDRKIDSKFEEKIIRDICKYDVEYNVFLDTQIYDLNDILNPITPFRNNVKEEGIYYAR